MAAEWTARLIEQDPMRVGVVRVYSNELSPALNTNKMIGAHSVGVTQIKVDIETDYAVGDLVRLDPGGGNDEMSQIKSFAGPSGSDFLWDLEDATVNAHVDQEKVNKVPNVEETAVIGQNDNVISHTDAEKATLESDLQTAVDLIRTALSI